ncbi:PAS domain-containing protein [Aquibaculum sediminis]|uniref:PAS domain-containing protein n=1 Tax=Aquibaculum sediminis TaxID=3231907 RepID=UPI003456C0E3
MTSILNGRALPIEIAKYQKFSCLAPDLSRTLRFGEGAEPMANDVKAAALDLRGDLPPRLRKLLDYWQLRRGERRAPTKIEMDPADFSWALAFTLLVEVEQGKVEQGRAETFRYAIVGEGVRYIHGHSLKGLAPTDLRPRAFGELVQQHYRACSESWQPLAHSVLVNSNSQLGRCLRLILPLTDASGERISHLLVVENHEHETRCRIAGCLPRVTANWHDVDGAH